MMTPLAMMMMIVFKHLFTWMMTELKKGWMSSSPTRQVPQDHEVSLLNTSPRYGASCKKTPEGRLIQQLKHLYKGKILHCHSIMVLMIACYDTNTYRIISSWTPSSLLRRSDDPLEGTHVANSLSRIKDSYTSSQCEGNQKFFKQSNSSPRKLGRLPRSLQICLVNKCLMTSEILQRYWNNSSGIRRRYPMVQ